MNITEVFDHIVQHVAVSKIAVEDYDAEVDGPILDDLKNDYKMAVLSLLSFVEKNASLLRSQLLDGKEPPKLWTNVFIK